MHPTPISEEDRMKMLIAKCFEDGLIPEKFCHGEWIVEGGIRLFKVNPGLDAMVTAWLKERTVIVIFQGEARDLPLRIREDWVRAYENGWYKEKAFDRSFRRGKIHGEGPNVLSYVVKRREVARWMIAKGEDKVEIRGIEYAMVFKPWMTKAELEERRRVEDATKFWVMALRLPLRVMFHIESMVESSMGQIVNSLPLEPDKSRPKLMNLKFELVREAEDRFEEELPIKLDDDEIYYIKFACKNTPWCETCQWYFHTATDGCPRMGESRPDQQAEPDVRRGNERRGRGGELNGELNGSFRAAARDVQPRRASSPDAGSSSHENLRAGGIQPTPTVRQPIDPKGKEVHQEEGLGRETDGVKEIHQVLSGVEQGIPGGSQGPSVSGTHAASPSYIRGGVETHQGGAEGYKERWLMPLVCTMQGQEIHIIGVVSKEGKMVLPTQQIDGLATLEVIIRKVRELFADRFNFRVCPDGLMPKLDVELPRGKRIRYSIPLIDAHFEQDQWLNISSVGLTSVPINAFADPSHAMLSQIVVDPGILTIAFQDLRNKMSS
ncbi:hypothetical protein CBR_g19694 [Chara braunii]|uniref:DUF4283 domain-containing protein n=1 Tax=Chara braunii TaxID=69332 RepID=A0A388KYR2_CHABU|nr:hypothetical protein CBR_g19694 [Chara braunii]|eukprot:GBG75181.1 hypothetical protein CBR_g19694 [Chara braunii]